MGCIATVRRDENNQRQCLRDKVEGGIEWVLAVKNNQTSYSGGSDQQRTGRTHNCRKQPCVNTWLRGKQRVQLLLLLRLQTSKLEGSLKFKETK